MKYTITLLLILICFGCNGKKDGYYQVNVDSARYVSVKTNSAHVNAETIRINGAPNIIYDTCEPHLTIFGLSVSTSQRISIRGLFVSNDTIFLNKEATIVFYGKDDSVLRVITGSDRPLSSPFPKAPYVYHHIRLNDSTIMVGKIGHDTITVREWIPPQPSPIPDTVPSIKDKIKMQPRWRDLGGGSYYSNSFDNSDTSRCILLVADTSSQNGFRSSRCFWMYGYRVRGEDILEEWGEYIYLDDRRLPLPKNIVVFLSKELK